jgi:hypothetical protein
MSQVRYHGAVADRIRARQKPREFPTEMLLPCKTFEKSSKIWRACKILGKLTKICGTARHFSTLN